MPKDNTKNVVLKDRIFLGIFSPFISIIALIIIYYVNEHYNIEIETTDGMDALKVMISVWITILGFLVTSVSILLTIPGGNFIEIIKNAGHFKTILYTFLLCCIHSFIALIFSIICVFCKIWNMLIFSILCAMVIDTMILILIAIVFMFFIVMKATE